MMEKLTAVLAAVAVTIASARAAPLPPRQFDFATVALSGQPAADIGGGVNYGELGMAELNNRGEVAFWSDAMTGPGVDPTNSGARFAGATGVVRLVARTGDRAPGTPDGVRFGPLTAIHMFSDSGHVAFESQLVGAGVDGDTLRGIWSGPPGSLRLLAREGAPAPGMPAGVEYAQLQSSVKAMDARGRVGFIGRVRGPGIDTPNNNAAWLGSPGDVVLVARQGDQPPGLPAGVRFADRVEPYVSGSGNVAFDSQFTGSGINTSNYAGIFAGPPEAVQLVARLGQQAPGLPDGVPYQPSFGSPKVNDAGHVAFGGHANGQSAAWAGPPGALQLLAIGGAQAPGAPDGLNFYSLQQGGPYLAPAGDVVMVWELRSPTITSNQYGLFTGHAGDLRLLARSGDAAPGATDGSTFLRFFPVNHMLSDGTLAFQGNLQGPAVTNANDVGIWVADGSGGMELVVREGQTFDVGGGDLRIIDRLSFSSGSGINDARQVAFQATFTDGSSGVFVSVVPEPASGAVVVAILAGAGLLWRRGR
jgi:hypothetical protein